MNFWEWFFVVVIGIVCLGQIFWWTLLIINAVFPNTWNKSKDDFDPYWVCRNSKSKDEDQ